jgi:hypothetical protein
VNERKRLGVNLIWYGGTAAVAVFLPFAEFIVSY